MNLLSNVEQQTCFCADYRREELAYIYEIYIMGRKRKMRKKVFSKVEISVKIPSALKKKKKNPSTTLVHRPA